MNRRVRVKLLLGLATAVLMVASGLTGAVGGASGGNGAPKQRLLVMNEAFPGRGLELMNERGKTTATLALLAGLNSVLTVDRRGTRIAYVQTLGLDLPPMVPRRFRQRFRRLPESILEFGTFLENVPLPSGGSFTIVLRGSGGVTAAKPFRLAWSPNGRMIVFAQARRGRVHLFVAPVGGTSTPRQLTLSPGRDLNPSWSPDGRVIVFERHVAGEADLYSVRPNGTGLRRLTYWRGQEVWPDFSPDSRFVVFSSNLTGSFQLYVFETDESFPRRLTSDFGNDRRPAWSPDGRWIAFSSDRDGDDDVFLTSPDGSRERKLTHNGTQDLVQGWQPLLDAAPPSVRALPSSSPRGGPAVLRFTVRDASRRVRVGGDAQLRLTTPEGTSFYGRGLDSQTVRTDGGPVHVLRVPAEDLSAGIFDDVAGVDVPTRFRFCLSGVDPWGNTSRPSCAAFRFR